jgi:hypothetical protein
VKPAARRNGAARAGTGERRIVFIAGPYSRISSRQETRPIVTPVRVWFGVQL